MIDFSKIKNIIQGKDDNIEYFEDIFYTNTEVLVANKDLKQVEAEIQVIKDLTQETGLSFDEIASFVDGAKNYRLM